MTLDSDNRNGHHDSDEDLSVSVKKPRIRPIIHSGVEAPICESCQKQDFSFFDPNCPGCQEILFNPTTTIPEIFAVIRQWTPQSQQNIELLISEIFRRGGHVNDRDGLTDMTLLHYVSKSGATGIGDPDMACTVLSDLLSQGADTDIRCRWTNMTALHYAAYFDVVPVIKLLLKATKALDIDSTCSEFDHGSSLHIASSNLSYEAVRILLQNGANSALRDDLGRTPLDCVPDPATFDPESEAANMSTRLTKVLSEAVPVTPDSVSPSFDMVQSKVTLQAMGLRIGDKITVGGIKVGTLRYCGPTEFASGVWGGIELDEPVGKNDGSIAGVSYFRCPRNHGIFAPVSKICKLGSATRTSASSNSLSKRLLTNQASKSFDKSRVTAKIDTGLTRIRSSSVAGSPEHDDTQIDVGDSVIVAGQRKGTIRFVGETKFAPGVWYGIALDKAAGRNDGSVNGERYFSCRPKHGVFAPLSRIQRLGNHQFSSEESLETISLGNVSEKDQKRISTHSTHSAPGCLSRTPAKQIRTRSAPIPVSSITRTPGSGSKLRLQEGMTVFCNNELGVARYIGPIDFASGTWIGVELRTARGKNDGSVQGKRYFTCKPDHGVLVRPNRVSVRGISGSKLLLG